LYSSLLHPTFLPTLSPPPTPPPTSTLSPYTTLFRSVQHERFTLRNFDLSGQIRHVTLRVDVGVLRVIKNPEVLVDANIHIDPKRSEEHTSELQSRFDLVCRLLLEKKKTRRRQGRRRP